MGGRTEYTLTPEHGHLHVHTARAGVASGIGHDLTAAFRSWSARLSYDPAEPAAVRIAVEVDLRSFEVVAATGGLKPLSGADRREITDHALKALGTRTNPTAYFRACRAAGDDDAGTVSGTLTLNGTERPVQLRVRRSDSSCWLIDATVTQTQFHIKPYRALLGVLRLADAVRVSAEVRLPAA